MYCFHCAKWQGKTNHSAKSSGSSLFFIFALLLLFASAGCSKENEDILNQQKSGQTDNCSEGAVVLGDEIIDPYRLETMQAALEKLDYSNPPVANITANFKYVRIKPADESQLDLLQSDTSLVLWPYPLNYEIKTNGTYYHDPTIPDGELTWQYGVVPVNYQFPAGLDVQQIYQVFIPPIDGGDFYEALEDKAYEIAGVGSEDDGKGSKWTPSATIKAYDDVAGAFLPLAGVLVRARYGTNVATATTDQNGCCRMTRQFKKNVNYSIKWETAYWDIRDGALGQAFYNGPNMRGAWTLNIAKNGKSILFATAHRAAYKFFYGNCLGIQRPILTFGKTKIGVIDNSPSWGAGCCWGTWSLLGALPDILVASPHSSRTDAVFGIAIHELAHQSHLLFVNKVTYIQLAKEIHESWAAAAAWAITNHHYRTDLYNYTNGYYTFNKTYQSWPSGYNFGNNRYSCYTPLFIDLMDDYNQRTETQNSAYPDDRISGYTLSYIQNNILVSSYGLSSFRDALKAHKINGTTDDDIDRLLELYWDKTLDRH